MSRYFTQSASGLGTDSTLNSQFLDLLKILFRRGAIDDRGNANVVLHGVIHMGGDELNPKPFFGEFLHHLLSLMLIAVIAHVNHIMIRATPLFRFRRLGGLGRLARGVFALMVVLAVVFRRFRRRLFRRLFGVRF